MKWVWVLAIGKHFKANMTWLNARWEKRNMMPENNDKSERFDESRSVCISFFPLWCWDMRYVMCWTLTVNMYSGVLLKGRAAKECLLMAYFRRYEIEGRNHQDLTCFSQPKQTNVWGLFWGKWNGGKERPRHNLWFTTFLQNMQVTSHKWILRKYESRNESISTWTIIVTWLDGILIYEARCSCYFQNSMHNFFFSLITDLSEHSFTSISLSWKGAEHLMSLAFKQPMFDVLVWATRIFGSWLACWVAATMSRKEIQV